MCSSGRGHQEKCAKTSKKPPFGPQLHDAKTEFHSTTNKKAFFVGNESQNVFFCGNILTPCYLSKTCLCVTIIPLNIGCHYWQY
jgi:hypothetical protein